MSRSVEVIMDPSFKTGFFLQGPDPIEDQRINFTYLDYFHKSIVPTKKIWILSQWWTPYDFKDASYTFIDGKHRYVNDSREFIISPDDSTITMNFDSYKEYLKRYGQSRISPSQPWSHFLLEQDFIKVLKFKKLGNLFVRFSFRIDEVKNMDLVHYDPKIHAAQLLMYLTIKESKSEANENPLKEKFVWLGIPLFDNRYEMNEGSIQLDTGFSGATNTLIYTLPSSIYLNEGVKMKKEYVIDFDILPYIKKCVKYAIANGFFTSYRNLYVNYMNIGWELPGSFKVKSQIKDLHLEAIVNE